MYRAADIVYEEGDGGIDGVGECKGNSGAHSPPVPKPVTKKAQVCKHLSRFKVRKPIKLAKQPGLEFFRNKYKVERFLKYLIKGHCNQKQKFEAPKNLTLKDSCCVRHKVKTDNKSQK